MTRRRPSAGMLLVTLLLVGYATGSVRALEPPALVLRAEQERVKIIQRISRPTLAIFGSDSAGGGSGVVITPDGYALTNYHVVKPCGNYLRCGMNDGQMYDAIVVGIDPTGDVALIKLVGRDDFPTAELGDSDLLQPGQTCYVVGNPFVLATDFQPTVTYGIISGVHRYQYPAGTLLEYSDCIQTDAAINPGNSGGPLFNAAGQLVGVNGRASFEKRGRVNVGVGYAISINQIKKFMGHLRSGRIVDHATLGFTVSSDENGDIVVSNILESSDAYRRGIRIDDRIVALGGRRVATVNAFKNILGTYPKGWPILVTVSRGTEETNVPVRLSGVHAPQELFAMLEDEPPVPLAPKDGKPPRRNRQPQPQPAPEHSGPDELPESVKPFFAERRGYANYYFNTQNVQRLWDGLVNNRSTILKPSTWKLTGTRQGEAFEITLDDKKVIADLPEIMTMIDMTRDLDDQLEPPGSGGMLVALQMWRRLLSLGPERFGETYYLGTAPHPLLTEEELLDVLVGIYGSFETRFYLSPTSGRLEALELISSNDTDPCEIYFDEFKSADGTGIVVPRQWKVRVGDALYGDFQVESVTFSSDGREDAT